MRCTVLLPSGVTPYVSLCQRRNCSLPKRSRQLVAVRARAMRQPQANAACPCSHCRFRLRSTPFRSTPVSRMPLACRQPRVSKHSGTGSRNATRRVQTSHDGTARRNRCRSSASMAMAAIEAGDRQEMVAEGVGAHLSSLSLAADGPFEAAAGQPWPLGSTQQGFFRADLPPPAHTPLRP